MTALPPPVSALAAWVDRTIASEDPRALAVLSAASDLVAGYAGRVEEWTGETGNVPPDVAALVVQVAARVYLSPPNPNVRQKTSGPFTEAYFDASANGLYLTDVEKVILDRFRATAYGLGTLSTTRWDSPGAVYDPAEYPFGWFDRPGVS